jgi:hypothetical protein
MKEDQEPTKYIRTNKASAIFVPIQHIAKGFHVYYVSKFSAADNIAISPEGKIYVCRIRIEM